MQNFGSCSKVNKSTMLKKFHCILPLLFLLSLWAVFSSPYIFQGKVPFPSSYQVNHFHPWSLNQGNWGPVKNGAMPDIIDQIYPWRHFTIDQLKQGRIPWWNPNGFSGNPHLANVQSAVFSPMNLIFLILPFIDAWSLMVLFQPLLAGIGMYTLLRFYRISSQGSLLGSVSWMFCGFIVTWMAYGTLGMAISFLPFLLMSISYLVTTRKLYWGFLASLLIAFSFFSGHFQTSLYLLITSVLYSIFLLLVHKKNAFSYVAFVFILLGLLISLFQILPAVQFYGLSPRSSIFIFSGGIPFQYLVTMFAPDFFGNPVTRNDWFGYYAEWAGFVGIIPFSLALFTLQKNKSKYQFFFQILFLVSLLFTIETPLLKLLGISHIPVLSTSTPSRLIVIVSFSLSVLAGFGYDFWKDALVQKMLRPVLFFLVPALILFGIWAWLLFGSVLSGEHLVIAKKNLLLPTALFSLFFIITTVSVFLKKATRFMPVMLYIPLLLVAFDSIRFAGKWMPFDPRSSVFPDLPVIAAMQKEIGYGRVFGNIGAQVGTYYSLPIIEGYDPLYIDRYGEFFRSSATGKYTPSERSVVKIDRNGKFVKRVLNLLGVNLIYHPLADSNQSWAFPVWNDKDFKLLYADDLYSLYRNTKAISRPHLYFQYEVISDKRELLKRFYTEKFNYLKTLLLEEDPGIPVSSRGSGSIRREHISPTSLQYRVTTDRPGLLFLSDNYYPGWKAYVNGKETKILIADYAFRAIPVPKGESSVVFVYSYLF